MYDLCGLTLDGLRQKLLEKGLRAFHADQIMQWVYVRRQHNFGEMTNLDKGLRLWLSQTFNFPVLQKVKEVRSTDGQTVKFLWKLQDQKLVESVLIYAENRRTVCVSSQVGCPARCAFCASGKEGLMRNLTVAEIVEQVLHIDAYLASKGDRVTHIVYMGMGEPLENYENVVASLKIFNHPKLLNFSLRRITVSTVGVIEGICRLSEEGLKVNLVLSLHAPNQHLRKKIIPYARKYELSAILRAMDDYAAATGRDITFEYTLLEGINDQPQHAKELALLVRERQCAVNLIPYNPVSGLKLRRPGREAIEAFRQVLEKEKIVHTCRYTKGDDIAAACGQLALQKNEIVINGQAR